MERPRAELAEAKAKAEEPKKLWRKVEGMPSSGRRRNHGERSGGGCGGGGGGRDELAVLR